MDFNRLCRFYPLPHPNDNIGGISDTNQEISMTDFLKTELKLTTYRNSGYFQFNKEIGNFTLNAGTRGSYWTFNDEFLLSPRLNVSIHSTLGKRCSI